MEKCAIATCNNTLSKYQSKLSFYKFPSNPKLRNVWLDVCDIKGNNIDIKKLTVCEIHFTADDFEKDLDKDYMKVLKYSALPSISVPVIERPPFKSVREYVDDNTTLEDEISRLKREQDHLMREIESYDKSIKLHKRRCASVKKRISHLKAHPVPRRGEKQLLSKVFSNAQINVLMGKKKVKWSEDDLAMAFCLRQMSSKECYLYLKRFLNFPLPALSCVQRWAASV